MGGWVEGERVGRRESVEAGRGETEAEPVRKLFKFERDLARQIKALTDKLHETKRELRLDPENVQKVVEVALELAGQPGLNAVETVERGAGRADPGHCQRTTLHAPRPTRHASSACPL